MPRGVYEHHRIRRAGHPAWLGEGAHQKSKHRWLNRNHPKTGVCQECGGASQDYAFLRHPEPHTRNIEDYVELCVACHRRMDLGGESF